MNKKLVLIGVVILAVVVIGFISTKGDDASDAPVLSLDTSMFGSMVNLFDGDLGNNIHCEMTQRIGTDGTISVQTYVSDDDIRVDYHMEGVFVGENGEQKTLHMLSDGEYAHVWGDSFVGDVMRGMKYRLVNDVEIVEGEDGEFDFSEGEAMTNSEVMDTFLPIDDAAVLDCKEWNVDVSVFSLPEDVEFADLDNLDSFMMNDTSMLTDDQEENGVTSSCDACDALDGEMKETCLEMFEC
jgi:hypothetical protein